MLGKMRDGRGKVLIPGFYDRVRKIQPWERKQLADLPFVGSGVLGSALCMDKAAAKAMTAQAGIPQPLFDVRMGTSNNRIYDVSPDGRFLIASPVEQSATLPMTVVLNWQAGLKK